MHISDISKKLQIDTLKSITPSLKIELCEKESRQIIELNPQYAIDYLKRKFMKKDNDG